MKRVFFLLFASIFFLSGCAATQSVLRQPDTQTTAPQTTPPTQVSASQTIITPQATKEDGKIEVRADESALALLMRTHSVETKRYDFGDIVDSIDGVTGGSDNRYWIFYVNGKMSEIGAGEYKIQDGDQIVWKYQTESEGL